MKELLEKINGKIKYELYGNYILEIDDEEVIISSDCFNAAINDNVDLFLKCLFQCCDIECKKEVFKDNNYKYRKTLRITFCDEGFDIDLEDEDLFDYIVKKGVSE